MESAQYRALPIQNLGQILLFSTVFVLKKLKIAYVTIRLKNPHGVYFIDCLRRFLQSRGYGITYVESIRMGR